MTDTAEDVTTVREGHALDVDKVEKYLVANKLPGFSPPLTVKQFGHGQSNPTFLLQGTGPAQFVLRKQPPGQILSKTAHRIDREYQMMNCLADTPVLSIPLVQQQADFAVRFLYRRCFCCAWMTKWSASRST